MYEKICKSSNSFLTLTKTSAHKSHNLKHTGTKKMHQCDIQILILFFCYELMFSVLPFAVLSYLFKKRLAFYTMQTQHLGLMLSLRNVSVSSSFSLTILNLKYLKEDHLHSMNYKPLAKSIHNGWTSRNYHFYCWHFY